LANTEVGTEALVVTDSLSQKTSAGPSIGIPNILNLYLKLSINSVAIRSATNSDPKLEVSTVFCRLLYQMIGAFWQ
jgi:hypothetical protein